MADDDKDKFLLKQRTVSEKFIDEGFKLFFLSMASIVAIIVFAIFVVIFYQSLDSIDSYGMKFLTTSNWNPVTDEYGAFTAIYGTLVTSFASLIIAVPLGVGTAIFITEDIIPKKIRGLIGLMVELLAAIPSVVLGLWAIFVMEPFIRPFLNLLYKMFGWIPFLSTQPIGPGIAPAILILVVMILPIITSISRDSLKQVPAKLREAAYGIGATRWTAMFNVILPAAISGITGGVLLGLGRAMGETMAVTMIIGNTNTFSWSILSPGYTISAMLANQFGEADGSQVSSLMYAAFILMLLTLVVNIFAQWVVKRLSLKY
ncbi:MULTISPECIES: phosphate ABC transporter permease subunit PstC [Prochlorococcus]|uniref:Phosphate transport system permease protein n=1 Tax=Prochlorococcus marinus (strain SARG / CCMP1375 / SS120) TaxID=167539 RepID=Q7VCZ1_PROMA|nr:MULTISPECIES: phosphate ABC transporter permease subunit PstC [Prochlorococcus]AAP99643.1 ABC-type phosphate transport system permease component [Prochlorococcus marinus subsp. marinus str. CCMP1375]KGG11084.1 Phosphate transport system permease protein PstC [Prochlorococcus marinus str. LG]KGG36706.1 Phosphate transport system permease protein PstC [Prochlorococcus sp. SS52]